MKQILQNPRSGDLAVTEVPAPVPQRGQVLVRNAFSVVSPGTEKLMMGFAQASMLSKARSRPDLVRQVARKLKNDGPVATYRSVMNRLDTPQPLGYSCSGVVEAVGDGVAELVPGDRVACAGAGYANHAEFVVVPENLVVRLQDGVPLESASFATLGAIAMQGLRIGAPTLGEIAAVIGLGLIGQLAVQLLRANGCRVLGLDIQPARVKQALDQGAAWATETGRLSSTWKADLAGGYGADLALVTAASSSSAPIQLAADLCRHKGRVVLVGMMPMELDRRSFYEKELELRMSTSYGPGRYDRTYEETGLDYPLPYVRWTEQRNLQSFLELIASGDVDPARLDTETVPFEDAEEVYKRLAAGDSSHLATVFRYSESAPATRTLTIRAPAARKPRGSVGVSFVGAGAFATGTLLPALANASAARPAHVVSATGPSAQRAASRFGFGACGTDPEALLSDEATDLVFVATRHDSHARLAIQALEAGKAVWVEKPVGLAAEEVEEVVEAAGATGGFLTVGYNRRFSPHVQAVRKAFEGRSGPLSVHYVIAAGPTPVGTWIVDPAVGGGRTIGEVCHFVDLCTFLVGRLPEVVFARGAADRDLDDSVACLLGFPDGSTASIEYLARADSELPKERIEVSGDGRTARVENFRATRIGSKRVVRTLEQDKGHRAAVREVVDAVAAGGPSPFSLAEILAVSQATFAIGESIRSGRSVSLSAPSVKVPR